MRKKREKRGKIGIAGIYIHLHKVPRNIPKGRNAGGRQELII